MRTNNKQTDEVTKVLRIEFEHDGRQTADEAREYAAGIVISAIHGQMHGEENGVRLTCVSDQGEPEPIPARPSFEEIAAEEVENRYNQGDSNDETAAAIAEAISKAIVKTHGKGTAAAYLLDAIAHRVQSHCNPALSDEGDE